MHGWNRKLIAAALAWATVAAPALAGATGTAKSAKGPSDSAAFISPTAKPTLPPALVADLNKPLQPTPTDTEKKIAPTVKKAETGFFLFVWAAILAQKMGLTNNK